MILLPSFINAWIALAMCNDTLALSLLLRSTTYLSSCFFVMPLYISKSFLKLMACLIDTCWIKDPDHALLPQFLIVHELHPTYKDIMPRKCIKTVKISNVLSMLKEQARTYKQQMIKRFISSHFWWNMNHKSSKSIEHILAPL
jgi:hypothetical protein